MSEGAHPPERKQPTGERGECAVSGSGFPELPPHQVRPFSANQGSGEPCNRRPLITGEPQASSHRRQRVHGAPGSVPSRRALQGPGRRCPLPPQCWARSAASGKPLAAGPGVPGSSDRAHVVGSHSSPAPLEVWLQGAPCQTPCGHTLPAVTWGCQE